MNTTACRQQREVRVRNDSDLLPRQVCVRVPGSFDSRVEACWTWKTVGLHCQTSPGAGNVMLNIKVWWKSDLISTCDVLPLLL